MLTPEGPKLLEYNVRFGDPEAQVVLPRLDDDLADLLAAAAAGDLGGRSPAFVDDAAVCVVLAAARLPEDPRSGDAHRRASTTPAPSRASRSSTPAWPRPDDGALVTAGGRVLDVVGFGPTIADGAADGAYEGRPAGSPGPGIHFRTDIAPRRGEHVEQMHVKVAVLMGSPNDADKMKPAAETLERFGIEADVRVLSAHRTPAAVAEFASAAREAGLRRVHLRRRHGRPPGRRRRRPDDAAGGRRAAVRVARSTASTRSTPPCRCRRASRWRPSPSTAP